MPFLIRTFRPVQIANVIQTHGGHAEVLRLLIEAGADVNLRTTSLVSPLHLAAKVLAKANLDVQTLSGVKPMDLTKFSSETWDIINDAKKGEMPELEEINEVPEIPDYALPDGATKKKKSGKGKKGKKGKKGGKKKGGKKGGKKKKK
ncbi:hypothetical protein KUTeg_021856 [Tegillarca granosa]|uniref:Uncharacterized protein n=1 Tax=Tegillarca granosa TaxID=220873 RepID=A0ABQ9E4Y7_TEGGR|nr:hypothetical protein KUTeg_021856 [Tegillarca granosa]